MSLPSTINGILHAAQVKKLPVIRVGATVKVHQKIIEGKKERIQIFEGMIIKHHGKRPENSTITVRRISSGIGVERIFPLISSKIEKITEVKHAKVRRAKLYFLRDRRGKSARLREKYLGPEVATPPEAAVVETPAPEAAAE